MERKLLKKGEQKRANRCLYCPRARCWMVTTRAPIVASDEGGFPKGDSNILFIH